MNKPKFGKLREVEIRELWKHEQYDFSTWLAEEDNIEYLNEVLDLNLVDLRKEEKTGAYKCDIVAHDEFKDYTVIIENQLEESNHDHLGKIITYASGLNASVIVWIVKKARAEHRSAIEWLNNHTDENVNFFLLEIHAYCIGDSAPAPKFEVIERPNDYKKNSVDSKDLSEAERARRLARINFWSIFNDTIKERVDGARRLPAGFLAVPAVRRQLLCRGVRPAVHGSLRHPWHADRCLYQCGYGRS